VGIAVTREQQRLIDQHRAVPDIGRPAELGECHARDERLNHEQQETAGKNRRDEQRAVDAPRDRRCSAHAARQSLRSSE